MKPMILLLLTIWPLLAQRPVISETVVPVNAAVSVNSPAAQDVVTLSGKLLVVTAAIPGDPCSPGDPCRVLTALIDGKGTSQKTGRVYLAFGLSIASVTIPPDPIAPAALTLTPRFQLIPPNPVTPPNPNLPITNFSLPLSLQLNSSGQIASCVVQSGGILWTGNNSANPADLATATTTTGTVLETVAAAVSGIAFDGTHLWFSDPFGNLTKRTPDGRTVLASFPGGNIASTLDMAWDSKRGRLWRMVNSPPALQRIHPATGTIEAVYPLPLGNSQTDPIYPRAGMGVAYDPGLDRIYVSFCKVGCSTFGGTVGYFDPTIGAYIGDLFSTSVYLLGGLAFDPATGHLWVAEWDGQEPVLANMSLDGTVVFSRFARPGARFVDGFELVGAASIP